MKEYIRTNIKPRYDAFVRLSGGKPSEKLIPMALYDMKNKFALYDGEHSTAIILSDTEFLAEVDKLFKQFGIENTK